MVVDTLSPLDIRLLRTLIQNVREDGFVYYARMDLELPRLTILADKHYINLLPNDQCKVLPLGYTAVSDFDEQSIIAAAKEHKEEKKLKIAARRQWTIALLGLTWSIATFLFGLLINSDAPIKQMIVSLFKRIHTFF